MKPTCRKSCAANLLMWSDLTLLLLVLEVWDGKPTYRKSWFGNLLVWSYLTLDPPSRSNEDSKVKNAYNSLTISPRGLGTIPTYRKSWAGNLLVWSDLTLNPSFKVK